VCWRGARQQPAAQLRAPRHLGSMRLTTPRAARGGEPGLQQLGLREGAELHHVDGLKQGCGGEAVRAAASLAPKQAMIHAAT
jgi:hypothetical protein